MKTINLLSLTQAYTSLDESLFIKYTDYHNINPKENEIKDLIKFLDRICKLDNSICNLKHYYFGYNIPQISKELDLLRFGNNYSINIELKSENTGDRILKQLLRNKYYLGFLGVQVFYFTYVSNQDKLYFLNENDELIETDFKYLLSLLKNQEIRNIKNIDDLFKPSNYLVSPFNSTEKFVNNEYFLTNQQEQIKKKVINGLESESEVFISICGKAGTGKTLITYDIAKHLIETHKRVLIIHCGKLNAGHLILKNNYKWEITSIREYSDYNYEDYDVVIIDETQRIYPGQLDIIIDYIKLYKSVCVFSYDKSQCLHQWEINNNISNKIKERTSSSVYELTKKIRTNKEIASFIVSLLDKGKNYRSNTSNIELSYFNNFFDAKQHIKQLGVEGWKIINYTPSRRTNLPYDNYKVINEDNTHEVMGQEYDAVVAVIDSSFFYDSLNKLSTKGYNYYYHPTKMLEQVMTRTRERLSVIIIDNEVIMERCLSLLN